jgi:hypothetical protein
MIAHDGGHCTNSAHLFNDLRQSLAAGLRVFDTPHPLTGIDHETIRNTDPHLVFDKRAVRYVWIRWFGYTSPLEGGFFDFLSSTGTTPSGVRIRQSGLPEIPHRPATDTNFLIAPSSVQ